jgi:hypothetical protein
VPVWADRGLGELLRTTEPDAVVFCGRWAAAKHEARWAHAVHGTGGCVSWHAYRRLPNPGIPRAEALPRSPVAAQEELVAAVTGDAAGREPARPATARA